MALKINDLQAILSINRKINAIEDVKSILLDISNYAGQLLNTEGASILLVDPNSGDLHFEVAFGENAETLYDLVVPKGKGIAGHVAVTGKHMIVADTAQDPRFYKGVDAVTNLQTKCLMAMPLIHNDKVIGVIEVINPQKGNFNDDDIVLLRQFAEQAATAIANALLYKRIRDRASEMEYLYQISNITNLTYDKKELFTRIVKLLADAFSSRRISIMFINEETGKLYIESSIGIPEDIANSIEHSINMPRISSRAVTTGKIIFANDIEKAGYGRNKKLRYQKINFISIPVKVKNVPIGVINISEPKDGVHYSTDMLKSLQTVANEVGHAYESILNYNQRIENEKMRKEIDIMRVLQNALLISEFSNFKNVSIHAKMKAAEVVGGDFYDVYDFSPYRIGLVIGDVSGKGLPASLYMAVSRSVVKAYAYQVKDPKTLMEYANEILVDDSRVGMFVTVFYGVLDLNQKVFEYSNGGHNLQYVYKPNLDEFVSLATKGIPLGISRQEQFQTSRINLNSGDIVFAFTDGVVDAVNGNGEDFGYDRLKNVVREYSATNSATLVNAIIRAVDEWADGTAQWDDMTVVAFKMP